MSFNLNVQRFPHYQQPDSMDCGPTCMRIVAKHYGKDYSISTLREKCFINRDGVSFENISHAAESIGMDVLCVKLPLETLIESNHLPCIVHWKQNHFVVVYKINQTQVFVSDPANGRLRYTHNEFKRLWCGPAESNVQTGAVLFLEPTAVFYSYQNNHNSWDYQYIFQYISAQRLDLFRLGILLAITSGIQLVLPFLTQQVVDKGIALKDISIIYLLLIGQLVLYIGQTVGEFGRRMMLVKLSNRINLTILSQFLAKLMLLPMSFFDRKKIGDIMQRMEDHHRIERLISSSTLNILFSSVNFVVFGFILFSYNTTIAALFAVFTLFYFVFVTRFQKMRSVLDYKRFAFLSQNRTSFIQIVNGMQEIKLNNCEDLKRWEWEKLQEKVNQLNVETSKLQQWQESGSGMINEIKNILITFTAATAVIHGNITLGMMMATQYIVGQLNVPIHDFINFIREWQDAKISMERINEVQTLPTESEVFHVSKQQVSDNDVLFSTPEKITFHNVSFQYDGPHSPKVLDGINLTLEAGKVTAIVGTSGSGKTTLLKLLSKIHPPTRGQIVLGEKDFHQISPGAWRNSIGVVMQEGYIFNDTIQRNIGLRSNDINHEHLIEAIERANISSLIEKLPQGLATTIGHEGTGLSTGQKQRLLIARAIYHQPAYLFLDEATSSLDATSERAIINQMTQFFKGKTVMIIAHRLSTVRHADKIVVLEHGKIIEEGSHEALVALRGSYFQLVKNQLELGHE